MLRDISKGFGDPYSKGEAQRKGLLDEAYKIVALLRLSGLPTSPADRETVFEELCKVYNAALEETIIAAHAAEPNEKAILEAIRKLKVNP